MAMGMLTTAAGIGRRRGPIDCPSYSSQGRKLARNAACPEIWGTADRDLRSRKPVWIAACAGFLGRLHYAPSTRADER